MDAAQSNRVNNPFSYRPDIDGLRAVAVVAVVLFHAGKLVPSGFLGVDVFFVISGYLISGNILDSLGNATFRFRDFYLRRVRRIFPALFTVIVMTWIAGWFVLFPREFALLGRSVLWSSLFSANLFLWSEANYFAPMAENYPLLHLWSLGVEEQFYFMLPPLLLACHKRSTLCALVLASLMMISLSLCVWRGSVDPSEAFYCIHTRMWELLLGTLPAFARWKRLTVFESKRFTESASLIGFSLLALALLSPKMGTDFSALRAAPAVLGAALIICGEAGYFNRLLLSSKPMIGIGLISYPLYLWHWPLLVLPKARGFDGESVGRDLLLVLLSLLLALLTYAWVERPLRYGVLTTRKKNILVALFTSGVCLGLATIVANGFDLRFPPEVARVSHFAYDNEKGYRVASCFLKPEQDESDFQRECGPSEFAFTTRTKVLLWGDSHAAHLYPGLKTLSEEKGFVVAQYNASRCAPLAGKALGERPGCSRINQFVLSRIAELKPDVVIMAAYWPKYDSTETINLLRETLSTIHGLGVSRVLVLGSIPTWRPSLREVLLSEFGRKGLSTIPTRLNSMVIRSTGDIERQVREVALSSSAAFVSLDDILCDGSGCLTQVGNPPQLLVWDYGHLSGVGSEYLVHEINKRFSIGNNVADDMRPAAEGFTDLRHP